MGRGLGRGWGEAGVRVGVGVRGGVRLGVTGSLPADLSAGHLSDEGEEGGLSEAERDGEGHLADQLLVPRQLHAHHVRCAEHIPKRDVRKEDGEHPEDAEHAERCAR